MNFRIKTLKRRAVATALSAVCLFIFSGCAGPGRNLVSPKIGLANISVREIGLFEMVFEVKLRILNANDVPLTVKGVDCTFECNGEKIGSGVSDRETKIPSLGSAIVPITVYSSMIDTIRGLMESNATNELHYRLTGHVHAAGGFLLPPLIPFESAGSISLEQKNGPPIMHHIE